MNKKSLLSTAICILAVAMISIAIFKINVVSIADISNKEVTGGTTDVFEIVGQETNLNSYEPEYNESKTKNLTETTQTESTMELRKLSLPDDFPQVISLYCEIIDAGEYEKLPDLFSLSCMNRALYTMFIESEWAQENHAGFFNYESIQILSAEKHEFDGTKPSYIYADDFENIEHIDYWDCKLFIKPKYDNNTESKTGYVFEEFEVITWKDGSITLNEIFGCCTK